MLYLVFFFFIFDIASCIFTICSVHLLATFVKKFRVQSKKKKKLTKIVDHFTSLLYVLCLFSSLIFSLSFPFNGSTHITHQIIKRKNKQKKTAKYRKTVLKHKTIDVFNSYFHYLNKF